MGERCESNRNFFLPSSGKVLEMNPADTGGYDGLPAAGRVRHSIGTFEQSILGETAMTKAITLDSVKQTESKFLVPTYDRQPVLFVRGAGVYLWDSTGKKYLDFFSGLGVNALGHNHPAIQKVIRRQAGRLIHLSNLFFHEYQAELAQMLTQISGLDRAFFCNSGTEAWEGALKLARAFSQMNHGYGKRAPRTKARILAMDNS